MPSREENETRREQAPHSVTRELVAARPPIDHAMLEDARAKAEQALFGETEPPHLGRFILLKPIAGGGMGVIHRAYDPQLERQVALKLLHPRHGDSELARARLVSEARALARLSHPNVVLVYEVVEIEGQVVMVMELVEGKSLADWERAHWRAWRTVVDVYVQAGRGLTAAHELGIVHRDFKPANAIVGDDGRVRVLDFGLALFTANLAAGQQRDEIVARPGSRTTDLDRCAVDSALQARTSASRLTAAGEVLGTLRYMAPEQLAGESATVASDQFSFCVSLYCALCRVPPFAGDDVPTLRTNILAGRIRDPEVRIPTWLRATISRGLAAKPADRHVSMRALLNELARSRGWRRWRTIALSAMTSLIAAVSVAIALGRTAHASCDGGGDLVGRVWNSAQNQRIRNALSRIDTPYARAVGGRVIAELDGYRDRWSDVNRAACRDYQSIRISADRFDRTMQCLDRRLQDLSSTIRVLREIDQASVANAIDVAVRLPRIDQCGEEEVVQEEHEHVSVAARAQLVAIRDQLSLADAFERAGRLSEAQATAEQAVDQARRIGRRSAILEATLAKGRIQTLAYEFEGALGSLTEAEQLALEQRQLRAAVAAGARHIYAESMLGMDLSRIAGHIDLLEPLSHGLQEDHFARPLLLNYVGVVEMARGERVKALQRFQAAKLSLDGIDVRDRELIDIDMNLAMITEDRAMRETLARTAWERFRDQLGPNHVTTLAEQCRYAHYVDDPMVALALVRDAGEIYRQYHRDRVFDWSICASYQAFLTTEVGHPSELDRAVALYEEVAAVVTGTTDVYVIARGKLAGAHIDLIRARPRSALAHFEEVIAQFASSGNWWDQQLVAEGRLGAGLAEEMLGNDTALTAARDRSAPMARATAHFERAVVTLEDLTTRNEDLEPRQRLALARVSLARILRRTARGSSDRSRQLEAQAAAFYRGANAAAYRRYLEALPH